MASKKEPKKRKKQLQVTPQGKEGAPRQVDRDTEETDLELLLPVKLDKPDIESHEDQLVDVINDIAKAHEKHGGQVAPVKERIENAEAMIAFHAGDKGRHAGRKIAGLLRRLKADVAQLDAMGKVHKGKVAELEARKDRLEIIVNYGVEYVEVACTMTKDFRTKQVTTRRNDTLEVVDERAMTMEEMQQDLPSD